MISTNIQEEYTKDIIKSLNNNVKLNNHEQVEDWKYILADYSTLSNNCALPVETNKTKTQKLSSSSPLTTGNSNHANPDIVLITAKLNQPDEKKIIHYNVTSSENMPIINDNELKIFSSDQAVTKEIDGQTLLKQYKIQTSEHQPKTATILVSKSKAKTGLPLLLKKNMLQI